MYNPTTQTLNGTTLASPFPPKHQQGRHNKILKAEDQSVCVIIQTPPIKGGGIRDSVGDYSKGDARSFDFSSCGRKASKFWDTWSGVSKCR